MQAGMAEAQQQNLPEAVLEVIEPDGARRLVKIVNSPFLIGRGAEAGNHLQLADKRISRRCASIVFEDGGFRLEDSGQRHGIYVNGERVQNRPLEEGDAISFGVADSYQLIFHAGKPQESLTELLSRLEQASTLEAGTRDLRQLSLLLEAANLLQSQMPMEEVLAAMVDRAIEIVDADRALLLEWQQADAPLKPMLARQKGGRRLSIGGFSPSQTVIAQAVEKRQSVVESDVALADAALRDAQSIVGQQLRSVIAVPLMSLAHLRASDITHAATPTHVLGVLYLDSRRPAAFSRLERQILDALSLEVANVLDNARLMQRERERRRLEQEFAIASEIQQALLPKGFRAYPHFQVTGINYPCLAVGGDYFDLMEITPEKGAFVIADVSGKGLGAALVTAMLQGTFSAMTLGQEPARVFSHVNKFICDHSKVERYATLFFGMLDTGGALEYINAGHLPPLLVRGDTVNTAFNSESFPLGLFRDAPFKSCHAQLEPGDTLVLYTDGVNEATNPRGDQLGLEGLQELVQKHARESVEEMQASILEGLKQFTRASFQEDDVTLMIVRYYQGA